jgi:hypothetical protein
MWGPEGWKKVVVCVVSDGRSKINKRTLQVLTLVSAQLTRMKHQSNYSPDGLLSRWCRQRHSQWAGCHCTHFRVCILNTILVRVLNISSSKIHFSRCRYGHRRGRSECMPSPNHILPQRTEQEEAKQPPMVLQRFRPLDQAEW